MEGEDFSLLSKNDFINVYLNNQEGVCQQESYDEMTKNNQEVLLTNPMSVQSIDDKNEYLESYLTTGREPDDEDKELNDAIKESSKMLREQDLYLPLTNISRIMKQNLPENGKIAKDAKNIMQECVSEFISFITSEACDRCLAEKRKTLNGDDIIIAMETLGFDNYIEPLKIYLKKYKQLNTTPTG